MFCKHKWIIIENHKIENELEKFRGVSMDGFLARRLATRGVITVVQCEKCTEVKHIKTILE